MCKKLSKKIIDFFKNIEYYLKIVIIEMSDSEETTIKVSPNYKITDVDKISKVVRKLSVYFAENPNKKIVFVGANGEEMSWSKKNLGEVEKSLDFLLQYISSAKNMRKKRVKDSETEEPKDAKPAVACYITDQFVQYLKHANYGIGIADFLHANNYPHSIYENGSEKKIKDKVKKFLKDSNLYTQAKDFYSVDTDEDVDNLINFKNTLEYSLDNNVWSRTLNMAIFGLIGKIKFHEGHLINAVNKSRKELDPTMDKYFGDGTNTKMVVKGETFKAGEPDQDKSALQRMIDKEGKEKIYIPESEAVDGEHGYKNTLIMCLCSMFCISVAEVSEGLQAFAKDNKAEIDTNLLSIKNRIKALSTFYETKK